MISILPIIKSDAEAIAALPEYARTWLLVSHFKADAGNYCLVPDASGNLAFVCLGLAHAKDFWAFGVLPKLLPEGTYVIQEGIYDDAELERIGLAWGLGQYQFSHYRSVDKTWPILHLRASVNHERFNQMVSAFSLTRDLINMPAQDLTPTVYADMIKNIATECGGVCEVISGERLLKEFPAVHAVGRAGCDQPCLVDMTWGNPLHPKITLIGKGVCFDSGGLDIKNASGMRFMKKDMGGSAIALALAKLVMQQKLPIRLRLILPLVENAISGNSFHPGDIIRMRSGKTVEIGNTDAEGRLILADALTLACEDKPDYLIDIATLTGAARIAVGPEICAYFCNNELFSDELTKASSHTDDFDTLCRLPLYAPYHSFIESKVADLNNTASIVFGGAMTAALFLQDFVDKRIPWVHFDVNAWNVRSLPSRPEGGEAMGLLTLFYWLEQISKK